MAALVASVSNRLRLANNIYNIEALSHISTVYLHTSIYLYIYLGAVTQLQVQVSRTQLCLPQVGAAAKILELKTDTNL